MRRIFCLILIYASLVVCCRKQNAGDEEAQVAANVEVQIAKVQRSPIRQLIETSGTLQALPNADVKVSALVAGRIARILALEGDHVTRGQEIAELDASPLQDALKQAHAEEVAASATLENAQANEERTNRLFQHGIAAGKEREDAHKDFLVAQSEVTKAQASADAARVQLARTRIQSPIDGSIIKRFVNVGEQVDGTAAQPIFEVANFDPIEMVVALQSSLLQFVRTGQDVEVRTEALPNRVFTGKVVSVTPAVDVTTNTTSIRVRVPNSTGTLLGGMFASANIIAAVHDHALFVPANALVTTNNQPKVYVIAENMAHERKVVPAWRDVDKIEIASGVKEGEIVATVGSYSLADQMKVTIKK